MAASVMAVVSEPAEMRRLLSAYNSAVLNPWPVSESLALMR